MGIGSLLVRGRGYGPAAARAAASTGGAVEGLLQEQLLAGASSSSSRQQQQQRRGRLQVQPGLEGLSAFVCVQVRRQRVVGGWWLGCRCCVVLSAGQLWLRSSRREAEERWPCVRNSCCGRVSNI